MAEETHHLAHEQKIHGHTQLSELGLGAGFP